MGYELRLIVVDTAPDWSATSMDGRKWGNVMAMVDLCKLGDDPVADLKTAVDAETPEQEKKYPRAYIYGLDGNTEFFKDMYDQPLRLIPIRMVREALAQSVGRNPDYRRTRTALHLVTSFVDPSEYDQTRTFAILFGH